MTWTSSWQSVMLGLQACATVLTWAPESLSSIGWTSMQMKSTWVLDHHRKQLNRLCSVDHTASCTWISPANATSKCLQPVCPKEELHSNINLPPEPKKITQAVHLPLEYSDKGHIDHDFGSSLSETHPNGLRGQFEVTNRPQDCTEFHSRDNSESCRLKGSKFSSPGWRDSLCYKHEDLSSDLQHQVLKTKARLSGTNLYAVISTLQSRNSWISGAYWPTSLANWWAPGSMGDPVSKSKVESNWRRHTMVTSSLYSHIHTCAFTHMQHIRMCTLVHTCTLVHMDARTHTHTHTHTHTFHLQVGNSYGHTILWNFLLCQNVQYPHGPVW